MANNRTNAGKVLDFHNIMNGYSNETPTLPPFEILQLREKLLDEEYKESKQALARLKEMATDGETGDHAPALAKFVHELADLLYVTYGAMWSCGVDPDSVFAEVHRANMAKQGGPIRADGKQLKPPDWQPANVLKLIQEKTT
jgi:predicted HAD superfamily Cof-like phosphohydrolase